MGSLGRTYMEQARCMTETPTHKSGEQKRRDRAVLLARSRELGARILSRDEIGKLYEGGVKADVPNFYPERNSIGLFPFEDGEEDEAYS